MAATIVISYDVDTTTKEGRTRLRQVARACQDHGQRVQFSVFECVLTDVQWLRLRARLLALHDPKRDSLRFYLLGEDAKDRIEHHGTKASTDPQALLLI